MYIGIIGYGVVGKAAEKTFSQNFNVIKYDKYMNLDNFESLNKSDLVFVMVPTPFDSNTNLSDDSAIIDTLTKLEKIKFSPKKPVVIKSTVAPGSCQRYSNKFNLNVVFNPEFLRESTSPFEDFENQDTVVLGTSDNLSFEIVKSAYQKVLNGKENYFQTSYITAEMIKLSQNATLASRVAIANLIYDACLESGANYTDVQRIAFDRFEILGPHMVQVPGPDGKRGFGGKCLPKDILAFNSLYNSDVLDKIIEYNKTLRDDV